MTTVFSTASSNDSTSLPAVQKKTSICLNMIVKNEARVIERCLASVLPLIDTWVIVDTGSKDGTQDMIRAFLKDIPGELHERPWVNFGHNREEALQLARPKADYILFMDADDILSFNKDFTLQNLEHDFYGITTRNKQGMRCVIPRLVKSSLDWHWYGIIHEHLATGQTVSGNLLDNIEYVYLSDGARSKDPERYLKDIEMLKEGMKAEPQNMRYIFYLAMTYAQMKDWTNALKYFDMRIAGQKRGEVEEEVLIAKLTSAKILSQMGADTQAVASGFIDAYRYFPSRIDALYYLVNHWRLSGKPQLGFDVASLALALPKKGVLFVEGWIQEYGLLFEYMLCASQAHKNKEALWASQELLAVENLPCEVKEVVKTIHEQVKSANSSLIQKSLIDFLEEAQRA